MGPVPPEGNAGNPVFLLNVLLDCFAALAMTGYKMAGTEACPTKERCPPSKPSTVVLLWSWPEALPVDT